MLLGAREAQAEGADLVEIRLDALTAFDPANDIPRIIAESPLPIIITLRPTWEGGKSELPEPRRLAALKYAAILGAAFVDVEFKVASYFFENFGEVGPGTRFIVSSHNFTATPPLSELEEHVALCRGLQAPAPLVVKLVTTALDAADAMTMLGLLRATTAAGQPMIGLAMGEAGVPTRLLAGQAGALLSFATLDDGKASAPGQPFVSALLRRYRLREQRPGKTRVWGVVGRPVGHSKGPLIHNAMLKAANIDGVYVPFLVNDLPRFLKAAAASGMDLGGLSVTIPHKEAALQAADEADGLAAGIGAANTLVWAGPRMTQGCRAYNTDALAALHAIEDGLRRGKERGAGPQNADSDRAQASPLRGKKIVVLGAGGAGRALAFAAARAGAAVVIANRTLTRADELAASVRTAVPGASVQAVRLDGVRSGELGGDVLANTTQIGMHPKVDESPVPASALRRYTLVFDAVYTPLHTRLLTEAKEAGCTVVTGDSMFLGQAAEQFKLFTGRGADLGVMQAALDRPLQH
ncbi:Bifunctional 3-dehydroquinate dehydratase/shikimate dehydrogenase, chloroplastic [Auxenochlorella protothecoides]|nr:Bifunctional 3-dehydroquinate dehydratase/shikimate dehydrogenase, chloroplastic [Auxenochlorella protothecoides]KFM24903.1 Bifunctional 3-dehydroquinate dehydratase/shikimate dehydrogenase, chloroplastic [Auxenochlorella protothecoides]